MSTKIYTAWRIHIDRLNDFIDHVRPQIYDHAEKIIDRLMDAVDSDYLLKRIEESGLPEWKIRITSVFELFKKVSEYTRRSPGIDVDYSLNMWIYNPMVYIIPVGERIDIEIPDYAEDYSYWNNTDQPEGITDEEWQARSRAWDIVNCGSGKASHNARRLNHSVIDMNLGDVDFEVEMQKRFRERNE